MRALLLVVVMAVAGGTVGLGQSKDGRCDRDCLIGIAEQYLDALAAKDSKRLQLVSGARYTENGQRLRLNDGLWNSISARGSYKLHVADQVDGQIVTFSTMRENGVPIILAVRLKVQKERISEMETIVARSENGAKALETMGKPREAFDRLTPIKERMTRPDLIRTANMYFTGMQLNDGKGKYPFADDCNRIENGSQSTNAPGKPGQQAPIRRPPPAIRRCGRAASSSSPACSIS
jgi:hypothetical protein